MKVWRWRWRDALSPRCCEKCIAQLGLRFVLFLELIVFLGPYPGIANPHRPRSERTNQRPPPINIHDSPIQTFERVCVDPLHHT
ncbi:hypothetical protein MHYP_G00067440 [Metynnis hypsauchen]